jgi:hypothetical protein
MKTPFSVLGWMVLAAACSGSVAPNMLVGQWQGENRFFGMRHEEALADQSGPRDVEATVTILADGRVIGRIGGAELSECTVEANRGWLGRLLHVKTGYIIRGKLSGSVLPGSEGGVHSISAPFDLEGGQLAGSVFVLRGAFSYPYPFLQFHLARRIRPDRGDRQ